MFLLFFSNFQIRRHSRPRMWVTGAVATPVVVAVSSGGRDRGRAGASSSGRDAGYSAGQGSRGRARATRGNRGSSSGGKTETGPGVGGADGRPATPEHAAEGGGFRGAWLAPGGQNTGDATTYHKSKTTKALVKAHGEEEYTFYVTFHVDRYMRLGRDLGRWRRDFVTLKGREPQYEDMPPRIRNMEQAMLQIGFKLADLE